jgi:hypothetical protein
MVHRIKDIKRTKNNKGLLSNVWPVNPAIFIVIIHQNRMSITWQKNADLSRLIYFSTLNHFTNIKTRLL